MNIPERPQDSAVRAGNARLGVVAYDGDANQPNDTLQLSSGASGTFRTLSSANPATNFFNSAIARLGVNLTAKSPNYANQLGFELLSSTRTTS